ncbi:intersectin-EH binding protein Ibp1 [Mycobacterium sp. 21AC1]|uniref:intersectin-EH binding protein Ibp1 n=1 Tax=[Mycobacterium] appelbergii TaxID=2939269 RepID=UPI002938F092|nr:intersectin-EH binding protein Ibp1 [Mycobacterium sp. 21AC1]MDV3129333.1 intersectin-EH binding protein Ibp1 [Mycobacterium sp. 21AC1]
MAISQLSARRFIAVGAFAVALAAAPAVTVFTVPAGALAACPNGESTDTFTGECVPDLVPNSPFSATPANPALPSVNLPGGGGAIPCTGANSGQCIGLSEEQQAQGPQPEPQSTVGSSPTVTGQIG